MGDCDAVSVIGRLDAAESVAQPTPEMFDRIPWGFFCIWIFFRNGCGTSMGEHYFINPSKDDKKANERLKGLLGRSFARYWKKKRIFDLVMATVLLICTSPVMLIVAIVIKLEDPGSPVIYDQIRIGRHGRPFRLYKFRTMVEGADQMKAELLDQNEMDGPAFKISKDPRITRIGGFLRKTCLDELPQFVNVLKGDMSVVGPRPPLPEEVEQYDDYHKLRLIVTPGITCIWQIQRNRNSIPFDDWVDMDLDYIERRTMWFDLQLIMLTPLAMLKRDGR